MKLSEALDKTRAASRPSWKGKAVIATGGMMLIASFDKSVEPDWADGFGHAITDAINADDYESVEFNLLDAVRYRVVGQTY